MTTEPVMQGGDVSILVCPLCEREVHQTHWFSEDENDFDEAICDAAVRAHYGEFHLVRTRLIRWLTRGWLP